jgi:DNA repair exonuclease SbcCD ATPase subunit
MSDNTALTIPGSTDLAVMFKSQNGLDPLLAEIEAKAMAMVKDLDPANKKDRDMMKSAAYKVSQSKAEIDRLGKALTETQRKEIDAVNAGRNAADKFLTALRDKVKRAADDWEAAEELRVSKIKMRIAEIKNHGMTADDDSDAVRLNAENTKTLSENFDFAEFKAQADDAVQSALSELRVIYAASKRREDDAAELARLRAEADARAEADRIKAELDAAEVLRKEAQNRAEQEARDKAERDAKFASEQKAREEEAARRAQEEERAVAAKREADLIREKQEAEERHKREIENAANAERARIAAEKKADDDARAKREADAAHRKNIHTAIANALRSMAGNATPEAIADALIAGKVPHCEVKM